MAFGIDFDLLTHSLRMDPAWVKKLADRLELAEMIAGDVTPRRAFKIFGSVVWQSYVTRSPLCFAPAMLSYIRRIARTTLEDKGKWDLKAVVPPSVRHELRLRMSFLEQNSWLTCVPHTRGASVWSDASSTAWAAIAIEGTSERVSQGVFSEQERGAHIFLKEAYAALQGLRLIIASGCTARCYIDNLPLVHCLVKGHCSNFRGNILLQHIVNTATAKNLTLDAVWVPTTEQRADCYTRGAVHPAPIPLDVTLRPNAANQTAVFHNSAPRTRVVWKRQRKKETKAKSAEQSAVTLFQHTSMWAESVACLFVPLCSSLTTPSSAGV